MISPYHLFPQARRDRTRSFYRSRRITMRLRGKEAYTGTVTERTSKRMGARGGGEEGERENRLYAPVSSVLQKRRRGRRGGQEKWSTVVFIPIEASLCQGCFSTVPSRVRICGVTRCSARFDSAKRRYSTRKIIRNKG